MFLEQIKTMNSEIQAQDSQHWSQRLSEVLFALSRRANQWMDRSGTTQRIILLYLREKTENAA
jgi:hypothetical protein